LIGKNLSKLSQSHSWHKHSLICWKCSHIYCKRPPVPSGFVACLYFYIWRKRPFVSWIVFQLVYLKS